MTTYQLYPEHPDDVFARAKIPDYSPWEGRTANRGLAAANRGYKSSRAVPLGTPLTTDTGETVTLVGRLHHDVGSMSLLLRDSAGRVWRTDGPGCDLRIVRSVGRDAIAHEVVGWSND